MTTPSSFHESIEPTTIVMACDLGYAMPLTTMLRSLGDHNPALWPLPVTVLHTGFTESDQQRVAGSLPQGAVDLAWIAIDLRQFDGFPVLDHVSKMTYARLLMPQVLPSSVKRALYLDADMLVLGRLDELLHIPLREAAVAAVTDLHVDADLKGRGCTRNPGSPSVANYFNAGVILFDLERCERERVFERAMDYLEARPDTPYADQDALNVACDGLWQRLDDRWNYQGHHTCRIDRLPLAQRPGIVHFITSTKPWKPSSTSINAALYDSVRRRTRYGMTPSERMRAALATVFYRARNQWLRIAMRPQAAPQNAWDAAVKRKEA